jgi:RNA polymerase sigma factor (sigma-70 family)
MGDEPTDEALMRAYAQGDVSAFTTLYDRHAKPLWRFVLRHVQQSALADDLSQEVWCSVMDAAPRYVASAKFRTWLFTIANNRIIDFRRTHRSHASLDDEDDASGAFAHALAADSRHGPVRQLQSREEALALLRAVENLPSAQKEAFLLQAEGEMSVEDIAQATGTSFETAKSRLRYARHALREGLQAFAGVAA